MKRYTLLMLLFVMAAVMLATSCNKDDDNNNEPEPIPEPTPLEDDKDFHAVPLSITVGIAPLTGSIDGVETKKAFANGDVIVISNPDVLYEPLTISADGSAGKESAAFTAELKVKKGVELVSGTTKLSAILKNGNNYNGGKPLDDVKPIESPADGLDQYCCWSCEDFTYNTAANAITLAQSTVFVELNMILDDVIMKIGNAEFSETISGSSLYAVPAGTKVEIPNAKFDMQLDGKEQSIYHLTATAPDECIPHLFTIGEGKRVFFSSGNLQYRPQDGTWRIAPEQYNRCFKGFSFDLGVNYANLDDGRWSDQFQLGMWTDGGTPNLVSENSINSTLQLDQNGEVNISGIFGDQWILLSFDEWMYLIEKRPDASQKRGGAVVDGVEGWLILPDDWVAPEGLTLVTEYDAKNIASIPNQYTPDDWKAMEAAGAVFLASSGFLSGTTWWSLMSLYQTRTMLENGEMQTISFSAKSNEFYDTGSSISLTEGAAVRLAQLQSGNTKVKVE